LDTTFKVKGQGHQAALLTTALMHQTTAAVVQHVGHRKLLLRCRLLGSAKRLGAHGGGDGRGHTVAAARLQLVQL